ncbi:MAG: hypothetical protein ACXAC7_04100 [Candidatus Hodarchaeales archaeon]|jgi:hypothetical protein
MISKKLILLGIILLMIVLTTNLVLFGNSLPIKKPTKAYNNLEILWDHTYGAIGDDGAESLVQTIDGGFAFAGITVPFDDFPYDMDIFLVKTDANGIELWNLTYGTSQDDFTKALIQSIDGGYVITGYTAPYGAGVWDADIWLLKTDGNGVVQWYKTYNFSESAGASALIQAVDGGYILAGWSSTMILIKTDANGVIQWNRTYPLGMSANALVQTTDGGFALAGHKAYDSLRSAIYLVKTDSNGIMQWDNTYPSGNTATALIQTIDGGYGLAGVYEYQQAGNWDSSMCLVKTNANGSEQWYQTYGASGNEIALDFLQTIDNGYVLTGYTTSYGAGDKDIWLIKTNENGITQWNQTFGGPIMDQATAVIQTNEGNFVIAGITESFGAGYMDMWLIKTEGINNITSISTQGTTTTTPSSSQSTTTSIPTSTQSTTNTVTNTNRSESTGINFFSILVTIPILTFFAKRMKKTQD